MVGLRRASSIAHIGLLVEELAAHVGVWWHHAAAHCSMVRLLISWLLVWWLVRLLWVACRIRILLGGTIWELLVLRWRVATSLMITHVDGRRTTTAIISTLLHVSSFTLKVGAGVIARLLESLSRIIVVLLLTLLIRLI